MRIEVVTLLRERDDVDMGDGDAGIDGVTLDTEVLLTEDTEDTVIERGKLVNVLRLATDLGTERRVGVNMGLAVSDRLANDIVCD